MTQDHEQAVAITGLGLTTPLGCTFHDFADRILAGKSGIGPITAFDASSLPCKIAGNLDPVPCPKEWDEAAYQQLPPNQQMLLTCAIKALQDAGQWDRRSDLRMGVLLGLGAEWGNLWETDFHRGGKRYSTPCPEDVGSARTLHRLLDLHGPVSTVAAACASGNIALGIARQWIRRGWVDVVLTGSCERSLTPMSVSNFANLGALTKRDDNPVAASRPFDRGRDGFVMAEGGALFVLENAAAARQRGAKVYAEVAGFGTSSDAFHLVAPSEDPSHAAKAIRSALNDARLNPDEVDYVNAHATSTPIGDVFETRALQQAFGEAVKTVPVSGTKSMTGHLIGAASAIEAAICLVSIERQAVPPTINLDDPDPECDLCHVPHHAQTRRVNVAVSNSFGFGGSNTCLVLCRAA